MRIGHINPESDIYGPGTRFVIWTQGCSIHCTGCWNKQFWDHRKGRYLSIPELIQRIQNHVPLIEGISVLGGEPFDQQDELLQLVKATQEIGLTVLLYSGFTQEEILEKGGEGILKYCDILIDGKYEEESRNVGLQWRGSNNQRILFLSDRYRMHKLRETQEMEFLLEEDGSETVYGYPEAWILNNQLETFDHE